MRSLALCLCLVLAAAIYKDEAGKYDWALTHLGRITFADYILVKDRSRLVVQSERGALASLKMNGQVEWRKLPYGLDADFATMSAMGCKHHPDLITYAKDMEVLAAWDPEDGMLLWSSSVKGAIDVVVKQSLLSVFVCVLTPESLLVVNMASGKISHTVALEERFSHIVRLEKQDVVAVVKSDPTLKVAIVNVDRGSLTNTLVGKLDSPKVFLTHSGLVAVKDAKVEWLSELAIKSDLWKYKVSTMQSIEHTVGISDVVIDAGGQVISTISLSVVGTLSSVGLVGETSEKSPIAVLHGSSLTFMSMENGIRRPSEVSFDDKSFVPEQFWAFKGSKGSDLVLCRGQDDALMLLDQGTVKWRREEALGHAKSAVFVDLPGETLHSHNEYFISLGEKKGIAALPVLFLTRLASQTQSLLTKFTTEQSASLVMDNFGFNKLLIVTTEVGKVFALHSLNGETVWTRQFLGCTVHHSISYDLEQFLLITECSVGSSRLTVLSLLTGETLQEEPLPKRVLKVIEVEKDDLKVLVFVAEDFSVTLYPKGTVSEQLVSQQFIVFYIVEQDTGAARGYRISSKLTCDLVWSVQLPASERIHAFKAVTAGHIQQPAIATGLSKLLFKYLDSNLFVLATMKTKKETESRGKEGEMTVYLVSGVTGRIISKVRQDGVAGKISIDCDENWVVVHYWNFRSGRYEFLSVELYEPKVRDSAWEMILSYLEHSQSEVISSYSRPAPVVLHQTYASMTGFQGIAHTATLQGITRQDLLLIMNSGQLLSIDRRLLSPRRKPEEVFEVTDFDDAALPPYKPLVPVIPTSIVTHDRQVEGLQHIAVSWALLESTCFVAAYSLDLFVVRVMPEKVPFIQSFDMLTSDFNYAAIVLSLGVLIGATIVADVYFKKSRVKRQFLA